MFKKLREKSKNKKGFTLVELIVVIVIILVLAAVMVPSVLRYVNRAHEANCRADAATILVQLQAEAAEAYLDGAANPQDEINGATFVAGGTFDQTAAANTSQYTYTIAPASDDDEGNIINFGFRNDRHFINWNSTDGWGEVES